MADIPQEGRKPEEVKAATPDTNHEQKVKVTSRPLTPEELKKIQEQQQKKGFQLQIVPSKQGNELEVICRLLSALNGNVAALAVAVQQFLEAYKDGRPKQ